VPRTISKIAIAVGLGSLTYFVTDLTEQPRIWSLTMTVFIGGITFVVQFLVDVDARLTATSQRVDDAQRRQAEDALHLLDAVKREIAKIGEATELYSYLDSSAIQPRTVTALVRHASRIDAGVQPLIRRLAEAELTRATQALQDLGTAGQLSYEGEDRDWLLTLADSAAGEIWATNLVSDDPFATVEAGFWTAELGHRYLDAQIRAIRRGVRIRRVFVLSGPESAERTDIRSLIAQQAAAHLQVRIWNAGKNIVPDIVIFDRAVCYEVASQPRIDRWRTSTASPMCTTR
jgi:hypothetical protein